MQIATGPTKATGPASASGSSFRDARFAGLLASLASPHEQDTPWNDDQLADDVATISYEHALHTHARLRPGSSDAAAAARGFDPPVVSEPPGKGGFDFHSRPLKTASITIRLSATECAQLRTRATEAGITVSAYLRSCTLEVESLRAQVKEALAELRNSMPHRAIDENETEPVGAFPSVLCRVWNWFRLIGHRRRPAIRLNPANPFAPARY